tara:strand:- start:280 stop:504 length:225 start_codon:yes stop_codon:yes gene_type:complete
MEMQDSHSPQGSTVGRLLAEDARQLRPFAIILAVEVLPIPLDPVKRKECAIRLSLNELVKTLTSVSCPINSDNF